MLLINLIQFLMSDTFLSNPYIRSFYFSLKWLHATLQYLIKCLRGFLEKFLGFFEGLQKTYFKPCQTYMMQPFRENSQGFLVVCKGLLSNFFFFFCYLCKVKDFALCKFEFYLVLQNQLISVTELYIA